MFARHAWRVYQNRLKLNGRLSYRTLIVGTNDEAERVAEALREPDSGFAPLGYISLTDSATSANGLPVAGRLDSLAEAIRSRAADCLFVASTALGTEEMLRVATAARQEDVEMRVFANLPEILSSRLTVQPAGTSLALTIKPVRLSRSQKLIKRAFDLSCGSLLLLLTAPLLAAIAIAIRLTSSGSALFCQERVTQGGRSFTLYKFRTMVKNADLIRLDSSPDPSALFFKPKDDPRLTKVGRLLRSSSLDELPQLFNVLKGEMSLVGPRPLPVEQIAANLELLGPRHEVPAGVTGWWQINGRSDLSPEQAVRHDLFYIENWSLTLDLYIMLKTVWVLLARKGAY
jgi:exopolysaccharide biosynthesis polyprenyl glycosylphosphotransferase